MYKVYQKCNGNEYVKFTTDALATKQFYYLQSGSVETWEQAVAIAETVLEVFNCLCFNRIGEDVYKRQFQMLT